MDSFWFGILLRLLSTVIILAYALGSACLSRLFSRLHGERNNKRQFLEDGLVIFPFAIFVIEIIIMLIIPKSVALILGSLPNRLLSLLVSTLLILALMPLIRKRFSAQRCVKFWLVPCILTELGFYASAFVISPWLTIHLSRTTMIIVFTIWFAGLLTLLSWKVIAHLCFRKTVLRNSLPVSDQKTYQFRKMYTRMDISRKPRRAEKMQVVQSSAVSSPISIGLFARTTYVVLPNRDYTEEELALIFRHESIHLMHMDNGMKFTMAFFCALGWFIPSLWIGMRRAAEDLELRCDEEATAKMDENERKEYIDLLLKNVGTEKGFTTCLSATASGLRYRLSRILHPETRRGGLVWICILTVLFVFSLWSVRVMENVGTIQSEIFDNKSWKVTGVAGGSCNDPEAVEAWLAELKLGKMTWNPLNYGGEHITVRVDIEGGDYVDLVFFSETNYLQYYKKGWGSNPMYHVDGTIDLEWLKSMAGGDSPIWQ